MALVKKMSDCPYFWNLISERKMSDLLARYTTIKKITLCMAYFSNYGYEVLTDIINRNKINKDNVKVYISRDFCTKNCAELLKNLRTIAKVKIYDPEREIFFHPKMIIIEDQDLTQEIIIGSSNFTFGGLNDNVEMNVVKSVLDNEKKYIESFVDHIERKSIIVTDEVIIKYEQCEEQLKELARFQKEAQKTIKTIFISDPFSETEYNWKGQYFNFLDYETFFSKNVTRLKYNHRKIVREKLEGLHKKIKPLLEKNKIMVNPHPNPKNLTSLTIPCVFNHGRVDWLGVRYGKGETEISELMKDLDWKDDIGFQKHACLQYSIGAEGVSISLFHAVPNGAIDREFLHQQMEDSTFKKKLVQELKQLEGTGAIWDFDKNGSFDFNEMDAEDFIDYYKENDKPGLFSFLYFWYEPDDKAISDDNIVDKIVSAFQKLYPIYQLIAKRYN